MAQTSYDSAPGSLDSPHRRRGEMRLEAIANSALLKILQFLLTGIALPAALWGINAVITRMDSFEQKFIALDKESATKELRLLQTEKTTAEMVAANQTLRERVLALEFQLRMTTKGTQ